MEMPTDQQTLSYLPLQAGKSCKNIHESFCQNDSDELDDGNAHRNQSIIGSFLHLASEMWPVIDTDGNILGTNLSCPE